MLQRNGLRGPTILLRWALNLDLRPSARVTSPWTMNDHLFHDRPTYAVQIKMFTSRMWTAKVPFL